MRETHLETLSALLDGERVSPHLVEEALDDREARAWLVDAISMRELLGDEEEDPALPGTPRVGRGRGRWLIAASVAAGITFGALGSWALFQPEQRSESTLPVPDKIVYLDEPDGETP